MFMCQVYSRHAQEKIVDVVLERRKPRKQVFSEVSHDLIGRKDEPFEFEVNSTKGDHVYHVNLELGYCTCPQGNSGASCKHQLACSEYSSYKIPHLYKGSASERIHLLKVARGGNQQLPNHFFIKYHNAGA